MTFDFMKDFMMFEDEERFAGLCEQLEEVIREADGGEGRVSELEIMQALDYVGFNLFRDSWDEFKKMEFGREFGRHSDSGGDKNYLH